jgi:class 3 adenylate cyclase/dihydrofolate reductase
MRRLILAEFMTLDGVMEAPGLEEHRHGRNAWALRLSAEDLQRHNIDQIADAGAILLGRVTYEIWAAFWPTMRDEEGFADQVNALPKYVVSDSMTDAAWANTTIVRGADLAETVRKLKAEPGGDILTFGSADLAASLVNLGLADQLRLLLFPVVLGSGKHLFRDNIDTMHMRLVESRTFSSGVVLLTYEQTNELPETPYTESYAWTDEQIQSLHAAQDTDRVLATVMFTDIVDSTRRAADLGDRQWRRLLDRHDEIARAEVERWHGRFVKSTGDGILATFDAPTRALRCAFALRSGLSRAGIDIRTALHTGEIENRDADIGGIGVHIAARALSETGPRDIVVTQTVRDLATGTDLTFRPLGSVGLRGVPGEWPLFAASLDGR